jgi:hypothetical protein
MVAADPRKDDLNLVDLNKDTINAEVLDPFVHRLHK